MKPRVIVVLTPGRTGSTLLMSIIERLGVNIGIVNSYKEHQAISRLMREIAKSATINGRWAVANRWRYETPDRSDIGRLRALIRKELCATDIFATKDPRYFYMLPMLRAALGSLGVDWSVIVSLRMRGPCVKSMASGWGDCLGGTCGCETVYDYFNETVESELVDIPHCTVWMHDLVSNWRGVVRDVGMALSIDWPVPIDDAASFIDEMVNPKLVHFV